MWVVGGLRGLVRGLHGVDKCEPSIIIEVLISFVARTKKEKQHENPLSFSISTNYIQIESGIHASYIL